jgi:hypothetical protein
LVTRRTDVIIYLGRPPSPTEPPAPPIPLHQSHVVTTAPTINVVGDRAPPPPSYEMSHALPDVPPPPPSYDGFMIASTTKQLDY